MPQAVRNSAARQSATLWAAQGVLTVVKDLRLRDLYRSAIAIEYGELDKELQSYLNQSEQVPSLVEIGVVMNDDRNIEVCGGWLIQALPGHGHDAVEQLAARLKNEPPVESLLAGGADPDQLMDMLLPTRDYIVLDRTDIKFSCSCSKERSAKALRMLPAEDRLALIAEGEAVVDCHFCHARAIPSLEMSLKRCMKKRSGMRPQRAPKARQPRTNSPVPAPAITPVRSRPSKRISPVGLQHNADDVGVRADLWDQSHACA